MDQMLERVEMLEKTVCGVPGRTTGGFHPVRKPDGFDYDRPKNGASSAAQKWGCNGRGFGPQSATGVQATDQRWTVTKVQSNKSRDSSPFSVGSRHNLGAELMEYNTQAQQQRKHTMVHLFTRAWCELVETDTDAAAVLMHNHFVLSDDMTDTETKVKWVQMLYKHAENVNECESLFKSIGRTNMIGNLFRTVMMYPKPMFYTCIEILMQQLPEDRRWITHVATDMLNLSKFEPRGAHGTEFESHLVRMVGGICYHFLMTSEKDTFWAVLARTVIKLVGRICSNPPDNLSNMDDDQYYVKTFELLSFLADIPEYKEEAADVLCGMGTVLDEAWAKHRHIGRVASVLKAYEDVHTEWGGRQTVADETMATEDAIRTTNPLDVSS